MDEQMHVPLENFDGHQIATRLLLIELLSRVFADKPDELAAHIEDLKASLDRSSPKDFPGRRAEMVRHTALAVLEEIGEGAAMQIAARKP